MSNMQASFKQAVRMSFSMRTVWQTVIFIFFLLTAGEAATASKKPIKVNPDELEKITFTRLIVRPQDKHIIDIAPEDFSINVTDELRRHGYNVAGYENLVFGVDQSHKARFLLGGTIRALNCKQTTRRSYSLCHLAILWQLFDPRQQKTIYRTETRAFLIKRLKAKLTIDNVYKMIFGNLRSLLSRHNFVKSVKKRNTHNSQIKLFPIGEYRYCDTKLKLPRDMEQALAATVVVRVGQAVGSGVIITKDGYILTAHHVVADEREVDIRTRDGKQWIGEVVRFDESQDVALIKSSIPFKICLPTSSTLPKTGSEVYIVGSPKGQDLAFSVSKGVISGLRHLDGSQFIQTDASINQGNSGGPMLNLSGQIVGIVSWKVVSYGFEGLGFATPIGVALPRLAVTPGNHSNITPMIQHNNSESSTKLLIDPADRIPQAVCVRPKNCFTSQWLIDAHDKTKK
ncbi:MAG: trypsin-like peptidase domain-containing protein [Myxococcota bacterium]|nr:trypsin-like peptidase domain-containing protein [Myxococcota bacterium]